MYELPAPPASGIVTDSRGITWRRNAADTWDPEPCPTCQVSPGGGLTWLQLLGRGVLRDVTPPA